MRYSRNALNKYGDFLVSNPEDELERLSVLTRIDEWREDHLKPLQELYTSIESILRNSEIKASISSQRLKRMTSIIGKIGRNKSMGLGGMQDIGGARFIFADTDLLHKAKAVLAKAFVPNFELVKINDYVQSPKNSGYRSIHFVYKYSMPDTIYDGLSIELQIRTKLQHDWATAVETAELISNSPLKASQGNEDWQNFFKIVSAIFARYEHQPVNISFKDYSEKDYCLEFASMEDKHRFTESLAATVTGVKYSTDANFSKGYVLLLINYNTKRVNLRHFSVEDIDKANMSYSQAESSVDRNNGAVVLVSVDDMKSLIEAYPSYFLNAQEFLQSLAGFVKKCKLGGYIK